MGVIALVVFATITNSLLGQFHVGFEQPIAHNQYIWNFFAMALCGLCFALGGGCPGKQLVNNFGLAASPTGVTAYTPHVLVLGFAVCVYIGVTNKSKA